MRSHAREFPMDATPMAFSRSPDWLEALDFERPVAEAIGVRITYTTRLFRRRPEHLDGKLIALVAPHAPAWRFGVALAMEQDQWIVTQGGYFDDMPATGED